MLRKFGWLFWEVRRYLKMDFGKKIHFDDSIGFKFVKNSTSMILSASNSSKNPLRWFYRRQNHARWFYLAQNPLQTCVALFVDPACFVLFSQPTFLWPGGRSPPGHPTFKNKKTFFWNPCPENEYQANYFLTIFRFFFVCRLFFWRFFSPRCPSSSLLLPSLLLPPLSRAAYVLPSQREPSEHIGSSAEGRKKKGREEEGGRRYLIVFLPQNSVSPCFAVPFLTLFYPTFLWITLPAFTSLEKY